ncbi:hypothetical protein ACPC54_18060 [Kitasatospora sp. NPDC094028]
MSVAGGTPVEGGEERTEMGVCPVCGAWVRGRWLEDITQYIAAVEHCPPLDVRPDPLGKPVR